MKRFNFLLAMLVLVLAFGLAFVGCKNDVENTDPKILTITGINGVTSEGLTFVLFASPQLDIVTAGMIPAPASAKISGPLFNAVNNSHDPGNGAWTGIGEYYIVAWETTDDLAIGPKYKTTSPIKFENTTTTVSWRQFVRQ